MFVVISTKLVFIWLISFALIEFLHRNRWRQMIYRDSNRLQLEKHSESTDSANHISHPKQPNVCSCRGQRCCSVLSSFSGGRWTHVSKRSQRVQKSATQPERIFLKGPTDPRYWASDPRQLAAEHLQQDHQTEEQLLPRDYETAGPWWCSTPVFRIELNNIITWEIFYVYKRTKYYNFAMFIVVFILPLVNWIRTEVRNQSTETVVVLATSSGENTNCKTWITVLNPIWLGNQIFSHIKMIIAKETQKKN